MLDWWEAAILSLIASVAGGVIALITGTSRSAGRQLRVERQRSVRQDARLRVKSVKLHDVCEENRHNPSLIS